MINWRFVKRKEKYFIIIVHLKESTVKQKGDYDDFQAPKPDPREMPPLRPLESDADVSVHNFSIWVLTVTRPAQTEIIC